MTPTQTKLETLYRAAYEADARFQDALEAAYGRDAGDARYRPGMWTAPMRAAADETADLMAQYHAAIREMRANAQKGGAASMKPFSARYASAVSRALRAAGYLTTATYYREGLRVCRFGAGNSVLVRAQFDSEARAQRFASEVAQALRERGWVVLHREGSILVEITGKNPATFQHNRASE